MPKNIPLVSFKPAFLFKVMKFFQSNFKFHKVKENQEIIVDQERDRNGSHRFMEPFGPSWQASVFRKS